MRHILYAALMAVAATPAVAHAAESADSAGLYPEERQLNRLIDNTRIISFGADGPRALTPQQDSVRNLISRFYFDQYRHFQDPKAPYFLFMSKDANLAMGVGGVVRMRGWYDWNGTIDANGFAPYLIQIPKDPAKMTRMGATPAGTALFFSIIGKNSRLGDFMGYIEGNFNGYGGKGFQLKKAFVTINDWTVGYAPTSFSDPSAEPPVIDGAGPNGKLSKSTVLVRYLHQVKSRWMVGGSVEFPSSQADDSNDYVRKCSDFFPDIIGTVQYSWDRGLSHVRLAALFSLMKYRDLIENRNHNVAGWGVQLSSSFKVISPLSLYAIANVGQGHASYMGDLSIGNYDLVADMRTPGKMYSPTALGLTFGAKYNFLDNLYAGLALGELRYFPKDYSDTPDYKYGLYGAVNLFWEITPRIQVGAEYLAGKRMNFDHTHGNANRIDAFFQLSF